jgi:hypothetical protein
VKEIEKRQKDMAATTFIVRKLSSARLNRDAKRDAAAMRTPLAPKNDVDRKHQQATIVKSKSPLVSPPGLVVPSNATTRNVQFSKRSILSSLSIVRTGSSVSSASAPPPVPQTGTSTFYLSLGKDDESLDSGQ